MTGMRWTVVWLVVLLTGIGRADAPMVGPELPLAGPGLESVPGPVVAPTTWPAPAQWTPLRYSHPLRALALVSRYDSLAGLQRVCRRMRASLDVRFISLWEIYGADPHLLDMWEQRGNPTADETRARNLRLATEALALHEGAPPYDVVFLSDGATLADAGLQQALLAFTEAGGVLAVCTNLYPTDKTAGALTPVWPAKPAASGQHLWMSSGGVRGDNPELAGLPMSYVAGHTWIPVPEPTEGARLLCGGGGGYVLARAVGKGAILFSPIGLIGRKYDAVAFAGRRYDQDEIWLRMWDQAVHELVQGKAAFPAYTDLRATTREASNAAAQAPNGQDYVLHGKVVNRAFAGPGVLSVHVTSPQGTVVYLSTEPLTLPAGETKTFDVRVPVAADWPAGLYPVYLTLGDPATKTQLHQSWEFIPVQGSLSLTLTADKPGYRLGETARLTCTAVSPQPWTGALKFGVYDYRGRLLAAQSVPVTLGPEPKSVPFQFKMVDHGVAVDTLRVAVAAVKATPSGVKATTSGVKDNRPWARAETLVYKYEPWSMRREYQWSTWANIAIASPSLVPAAMRLMAHAGMNALGFGPGELYYPAERWGWRYYNEGTGMNTFGPKIEYENDAEIEAAYSAEIKGRLNDPNLRSAAFVLGSVGEEAGFSTGWGRTYYWDTPEAPEKACRAFRWYLKEKYGTVERLNAAWQTTLADWDGAKLTKEYSGPAPAILTAGGWSNPDNLKNLPPGTHNAVPYTDTQRFYAWYYDRIIAAVKRIYRNQVNPVTLLFSSAPASWIFDSRENDVRNESPSVWNEQQMYTTWAQPTPSFGLTGLFEYRKVQDNQLWGFLCCNTSHQTCWVDVPLTFNNDFSHTRASFALRRWMNRLDGHQQLLLDGVPAASEVGVLPANGIPDDATLGYCRTSLQVALNQAGYGYREVDPAQPAGRILFAAGTRALTPAARAALQRCVEDGGTLVLFPRSGTQNDDGTPASLAGQFGLTTAPRKPDGKRHTFTLDQQTWAGLDDYRETLTPAAGWVTLAAYDDDEGALRMRKLGKGQVFFANVAYQSHRYIQWVTPTDINRQGFFHLVDRLCREAHAKPAFTLTGTPETFLHLATRQFTDPSGNIRYVLLATNSEVPWVAAQLNWNGAEMAAYDVLGGTPGQPVPVYLPPAMVHGTRPAFTIPLNLPPGNGKLLAFTRQPVQTVRVVCTPAKITGGQPLTVGVDILDPAGRTVPGQFPLRLRVYQDTGKSGGVSELPALRRDFSAAGGDKLLLNTALSDAGNWKVTVTDGVSGLSGSTTVEVAANLLRGSGNNPGFVSWGWPSELDEAPTITEADFLARLRQLAVVYRTDHSGDGWMAKQWLGYYFEYYPGTRHDLLTPLNDVDWRNYAAALNRAVTGGEHLIFTGEDLGIDPKTGLGVWPHGDAHQLAALTTALKGATWRSGTSDGDTVIASLGTGQVILCRESIDAAGTTNEDQIRWQQRWLREIAQPGAAIPPPSLSTLESWWTGQQAITAAPRTVDWLADNRAEVTLRCDPATNPLGQLFTLVLPPTGAVQQVAVTLTPAAGVKVDVGARGRTGGDAATLDWTDAVNWYLAWCDQDCHGPQRDDNNRRLVPVRITTEKPGEVKVSGVRVTVR